MQEMANPSVSPAFNGEFHSLPLAEDEQLWYLSPISPTMSSWNTKTDHQQAFANPSLELDTKDTHIRDG